MRAGVADEEGLWPGWPLDACKAVEDVFPLQLGWLDDDFIAALGEEGAGGAAGGKDPAQGGGETALVHEDESLAMMLHLGDVLGALGGAAEGEADAPMPTALDGARAARRKPRGAAREHLCRAPSESPC